MKTRHFIVVGALVGVLLFDSLVLPLLPEAIFRFLERAYGLHGWTQIVAFNDLFGLFVGLYWVGLVEAVRSFVIPREEGFLSLLLSKPISRSRYIRMQLLPIFTTLLIMGTTLSIIFAVKLAAINGLDGLAVSSLLAMGLSATLLAIALTAVATILCLIAHDSYTAVLLGFLLFSAVVIPAGGYMYRPDLYADKVLLSYAVVFPANMLWLHATLPARLPVFIVVALGFVAAAMAMSVAWMHLTDID
jgi:ABC-type transport system involved in multi-copper enzyme maturation permease subunit